MKSGLIKTMALMVGSLTPFLGYEFGPPGKLMKACILLIAHHPGIDFLLLHCLLSLLYSTICQGAITLPKFFKQTIDNAMLWHLADYCLGYGNKLEVYSAAQAENISSNRILQLIPRFFKFLRHPPTGDFSLIILLLSTGLSISVLTMYYLSLLPARPHAFFVQFSLVW